MSDQKKDLLSRRTASDRSMALVLAGTALLLPPVAGIFLIDAKLAGVPLTLLYILAVWALLIAAGSALARPLRDSDAPTATTALSEGPDSPRTGD